MTLEERVNITIYVCNKEIERQRTFMRLYEFKDKDKDWVEHYNLLGIYENIKDILCGDFSVDYYLGEEDEV